ncbi:MAG: hypothetical protein ACYTG6_08020, partial [Planctomycetota bacterium]
ANAARDRVSGSFRIDNASDGGVDEIFVTSVEMVVEMRMRGQRGGWVTLPTSCVFPSGDTPFVFTDSTQVLFDCDILGTTIPAGATVRVTARVTIFNRADRVFEHRTSKRL